MKVKVIGRDYKDTFKDILEEYTKVTKEFGSEYEEREIPIDDGYYIFIADSKDIYNKSRDELIDLWEESVMAEEEEEELDVRDRLNWNQRVVLSYEGWVLEKEPALQRRLSRERGSLDT